MCLTPGQLGHWTDRAYVQKLSHADPKRRVNCQTKWKQVLSAVVQFDWMGNDQNLQRSKVWWHLLETRRIISYSFGISKSTWITWDFCFYRISDYKHCKHTSNGHMRALSVSNLDHIHKVTSKDDILVWGSRIVRKHLFSTAFHRAVYEKNQSRLRNHQTEKRHFDFYTWELAYYVACLYVKR